MWSWSFAWSALPLLLRALVVTVEVTLLASALALSLGLVLALVRRSAPRPVAVAVGAASELIRTTPLLVQLYVLFFFLPTVGFGLSAFATGLIGLGVHYATYTAEVYRGAIEGVPRGQWEAAVALNLSPARTFASVILPQAIRRALPALGNYVVAMFKETPLLSAITVVEMMQAAKNLGSQSFRYLEPITLCGLLFLLCSMPASAVVRRLERHLE